MNRLEHLDDFKAVLRDYKISDASQKILKKTKLVLLVAPTSSGRNTIIRELLRTGDYHYIVSDTTRKPRVNDGVLEKDGVEYWFKDEEEVLKDLKAGKYLEAAIIHNQQVSGINIRALNEAYKAEKIAITDIETIGTHNILQAKPDTIAVFVLPPGFEEWQRRIHHRGEMSGAELKRRLQSACKELEVALADRDYHLIINNDLNDAVLQIGQLAHYGIENIEDQRAARDLAKQMHIETKMYLESL